MDQLDRYALITPVIDPDHHTVGHYFADGRDGSIYYCDSLDPRLGYWMTLATAPVESWSDEHGEFRKNVSDRAIGRTFHLIYFEEGRRPWSTLGGWSKADVAEGIVAEHRRRLREG